VVDQDPKQLDDRALAVLAAELAEQEEHVSARRTVVHRRLDFVNAGGTGWDDEAKRTLAELTHQESELSEERQALHARIAAVAAERERRTALRAPEPREPFV
jgi:hypothetical protein